MNALLVGQLALILLWLAAIAFGWQHRRDPIGLHVWYAASVVLVACSTVVLIVGT